MYPRHDDVSLFQRFVNDHKLEEKGLPLYQLAQLEGTDQVMLGVDGTKIIDMITQAVREREKMAIYTYTTPYTVYEKINEFRTMFQSIKNCTPVFVFNGIQYSPDSAEEFGREKNVVPSEVAALTGTDSSRLSNTTNVRFAEIHKKTANRFVVEEDVEGQIIRIFRSEFKNTIRAPYLAWAQLSSFRHCNHRHISEVYGCLELLAFPGIDRVVTNINPTRGTFDVVYKARVLEAARLSEEDLSSLILVESRSRVMRTVTLKFSSLEDMIKKVVRYKGSTIGASFAQQLHEEAIRASEANRMRASNQRGAAFRNLSAFASPVLTLTPPHCLPLHFLYGIPGFPHADAESFVGLPLPPVLYYIMSAGLLSPSLFAAVSQETVVDDWPLVDSIKYRDVAETVLPLRVQTIYQLAWTMSRGLGSISWFRRYNVLPARVSKLHVPPAIQLDGWALHSVTVPRGLHLVDVMEFAHLACSVDQVVYNTMEETYAAILLQSLDLLGYLTHETQDLHEEGQSSEPSTFGRALQLCSVPTLSEYTVLLIELARTNAISTEPFRITTEEISPRDTPRDIVFASRVLSIIPLNVSGPWTAPIDAELAAFSMLSRMISRSIRQLLEAITTLMFSKGRTHVPLHMIGEIQRLLPFSTPVEFGCGVLVEYMLMKDKCTLKDLEEAFPECTYLRHDLATLFYFWDLAVQVLQRIETKENFCVDQHCLSSANERMKRAQKNLNILTGVRETYY
ncbi:protein mkt1 [Trypanosoma brucei equiperdum]|uniref:Protein mkt1 n=1 Tax=Trypanosoma brucei equiperdum TaxID=630700 RepID=A0A3L6L6F0_9TRYP|nr:protein mkt1 [Trypanosoma brucei equiperdum]